MKGVHLGEFEELVLLAVASMTQEAYAVSIKEEILVKVDRKTNISAIHTALYRLEDKGFLESYVGEATAKRGGKGKRLFRVTAFGLRILKEAKEKREVFWNTIPQLSIQGL